MSYLEPAKGPKGGEKYQTAVTHAITRCFIILISTRAAHAHIPQQPPVKWGSDNGGAYSVWSEAGCRWRHSTSRWLSWSPIIHPGVPPCLWPEGQLDIHPEPLCPSQGLLSAGRLVEWRAGSGTKITTATDFTVTQRLSKLASNRVRCIHFGIRTLENIWLRATVLVKWDLKYSYPRWTSSGKKATTGVYCS